MKRILITSTDLMMVQFLLPHVKNLSEKGYDVEVACSDVGGRIDEVRQKLEGAVKVVKVVRLRRNPLSPINVRGYGDMKKVIEEGQYDIIWTNEPVMSVMTRLAAREAKRKGTKVMYMAHGFHFYTGAPWLNWMVFYPIERIMAKYTDLIVTVNREDYARAKSFYVKRVEYIHGIGINTARLTVSGNMKDIRKEMGLSSSDFILLSVGELNDNKNQRTIIDAVSKVCDNEIHYLICGKGSNLDKLRRQVESLGLGNNVHFLGYRKDVVDICSQSDLYVMPSFREGLPVSSLEAMYCGLPLVTSNIRGLVDIMENGKSGYMCAPSDVAGFARYIKIMKDNPVARRQMGQNNKQTVVPFCIENTKVEVMNLIDSLNG